MVVEQKIQDAKECFDKVEKTGYNNYQKYNYIESESLFPVVREVCKKFNLRTKFLWQVEEGKLQLIITDCDDGSTDISELPIPVFNDADPGKFMQNVGRVQTYAMRYLYLQVFEIAVPDEIDNRDQLKKPQKSMSKPKPKSKQVKKQTTEPVQEKEPTKDDVKKALDVCYENITELAGKPFTEAACIFQLSRLYKDKPLLVEACKRALKMYTAEKEGV